MFKKETFIKAADEIMDYYKSKFMPNFDLSKGDYIEVHFFRDGKFSSRTRLKISYIFISYLSELGVNFQISGHRILPKSGRMKANPYSFGMILEPNYENIIPPYDDYKIIKLTEKEALRKYDRYSTDK